ncbi:hypothetical protein GWI34_00250 [Actinomadura sp. DSM 109109]|nr:hypothetical protein [Actinomadura lepetitiana]
MRRSPVVLRLSVALAALVLCALGAAPGAAAAEPPPHAYHRLDRVGAALARDPVFVDPDLARALGAPDRARLRAAVAGTARRIGAPVYVVVIPNPVQSESQGQDDAFLFMLHDRSRRDGLYVMADSHGTLETKAFNVPREGLSPFDEGEEKPGAARPVDSERPFDGLADRIIRRLERHAAAPSASPTLPRQYSSPDPFGQEHTLTPDEPEIQPPLLMGLFLAGPVGAVVLYWLGLGLLALRRVGRAPRPADRKKARERVPARTRPSMRWLRRQGARDLEQLRLLLAAADGGRGREFAVSAYDAAQILYDDAKDDESKAADLVGAIVLARRGHAALTRDTASPPPPCLVNPLHGRSVVRKRLRKLERGHGDALPRPCPICAKCRAIDKGTAGLGEGHLLRIPGPDGHRPHTLVPGVWRDTAWGAHEKNFLPRVMRYLGVD